MKKSCGRLTGCLLLVLLSFGCTGAKKEESSAYGSKETKTPVKVVISKDEVDYREIEEERESASGDESCQQDSDCKVIPQPPEACLPCLHGSTAKAVNITTSRATMKPIMEGGQCKSKFDELAAMQKEKKNPKMSDDPSCKFSGAKCIDGTCQLANLSKEELDAKQKEAEARFKAAHEQGKLGQTSPRAPQQPAWGNNGGMQTSPGLGAQYPAQALGGQSSVGGNWPIAPRNGSSRFDTSGFSGTEIPSRFGQELSGSSQPFRFGGTSGQYEDRRPSGYGSSAAPQAYTDMKSFPGFGAR